MLYSPALLVQEERAVPRGGDGNHVHPAVRQVAQPLRRAKQRGHAAAAAGHVRRRRRQPELARGVELGTFHHVMLQSKHQSMTSGIHVTNLTPI
jgi:hypothetical protein